MRGNFSVLVVCTGNVCRSPLAEHLLKAHADLADDIDVTSAGTHALAGWSMDNASRRLAQSYGAHDHAGHLARQLTVADLDVADLALTMTRAQRRLLVEKNPRVTRRVFTLREFARLAEATTDEDLAAELGAAGRSSDERLAGVIRAVAHSRGRVQPLADRSQQDIVDPFRKSEEAHRVSARQIAAAVDRVAELFRRALEISRGAGIRPVPALPADTWVVADQVALTGAEDLGAEPEAGNATQFA